MKMFALACNLIGVGRICQGNSMVAFLAGALVTSAEEVLSPDGKILATTQFYGPARLWSLARGR